MLRKKLLLTMLSVVALSWLLALSASAQTGTSSISGTVTDATGAVIAGAKATAKNTATGVVYTQTTTSAGLYSFPSLPAGNYDISVELSGFKTTHKTNNVLEVGTPLVVDVALQVGQTTEVVTVE